MAMVRVGFEGYSNSVMGMVAAQRFRSSACWLVIWSHRAARATASVTTFLGATSVSSCLLCIEILYYTTCSILLVVVMF